MTSLTMSASVSAARCDDVTHHVGVSEAARRDYVTEVARVLAVPANDRANALRRVVDVAIDTERVAGGCNERVIRLQNQAAENDNWMAATYRSSLSVNDVPRLVERQNNISKQHQHFDRAAIEPRFYSGNDNGLAAYVP